jgi:hypothetical protein
VAVTIRLMSDWSLSPFYVDDGDGFFELTNPRMLAERFDLPAAVVTALLDWNRLYENHLDWDWPPATAWATPEEHERYLGRGREAARLLRRHLPADVAIEYLADESVREYY